MGVKKIYWHQVVLFALMFTLMGWRLLKGSWVFGVELLWWWLGGVVGFLLVYFDRLVQMAILEPENVFEVKMVEALKWKNIKRGMVTGLSERETEVKLVMRSALFVLAWIFLGFWTVTSVSSLFAKGFMLGLGTHVMFDLFWDYFREPERLSRWFWVIKRDLTKREVDIFVWLMLGGFLLIALGL